MTTDSLIAGRRRTVPAERSSLVGDSVAGSVWTVASRVTGLGQSIAVATILGATYLGNTYLAVNALPNIVYYQLLAGSLFASILVPPLVARADAGDRRGMEALARGFYGATLLAGAGLTLVLIVAAPLVLHVLTSGVADATTAAMQRQIGLVFYVIFIPQILLYVTAGTGAAVMNAHGRFALAAGAPALENVGMIVTILTAGAVFGAGVALSRVPRSEAILLALGTTASVGLHAAAQWLGARRCGTRLIPSRGWRDADVRLVLRRVVPTLAYTGLAASQTIAGLVIANRLAGGLVAFQLALNFFFLPIAIVTWPIARSMLPSLARAAARGRGLDFADDLGDAIRLASFVVVPTGIILVVLAAPIADAIAVGQLEADGGVRLVAMALGALGLGVIGETWFILGTYAFYAREDVRSPVRSMIVKASFAVAVMAIALTTHRSVVLLIVGAAVSIGSFAGAVHVWTRLRRIAHGTFPVRSLVRTSLIAAASAVPAVLVAARLGQRIGGTEPGQIVVVAAAVLVAGITYLLAQKAVKAPEMETLGSGLRRVTHAFGGDRVG